MFRSGWTMFCGCAVLIAVLAWTCITNPIPGTSGSMAPKKVHPLRLEKHVRMLAETFFPRDASHPENLLRAADYIRSEFRQAQGNVSDQCFEIGQRMYCNIIARFGPETAERLVVGAHYDAFGERPGSDDNASGVAGLIELAHLLGQSTPSIQVELVAYTLEELPHFGTQTTGSAIHANFLRSKGIPVRLMISLEMIGYFSDAEDSQRVPFSILKLFYPSRGNFILVVGNLSQWGITRTVKRAMHAAMSLPVHSINAPSLVPGVDWSDHRYYWQAGYPALMITDTAFYRNPNYHTATDTPDTLDYERMALVVKGVFAAILALAR
jgi:Zn-dependent M28 family amino/carboxypeptidase